MSWIQGNSSCSRGEDYRPTVNFLPVRCPDCHSRNQRAYGKKGRLRYHQCRECELKFRSIEAESPN